MYELIKKYEGFRAAPYLDAVDRPTIGYGSTYYEDGTRVKMGDPAIDKARGEKLIKAHIEKEVVPYLGGLDLTPGQLEAISSLVFNWSGPAFRNSKLYKAIKANDYAEIIHQWDIVTAGGKQLLGLARRRSAELSLFFEAG
jgi:lysozyme